MQLDELEPKLLDKLNQIGFDSYDPRVAYRDLEDAWETIQMIADILERDITDTSIFPTYKVERCVIRVGTYHAYRNYTRLAERQFQALPQGSPIIISYDVIDAKNCLTLLFGVTFTDELLPDTLTTSIKPVVAGGTVPSILDDGL